MSPVGWEALGQWGEDVARIEPLAGGVANDVWSARVHGHLAVARLGARSGARKRRPGPIGKMTTLFHGAIQSSPKPRAVLRADRKGTLRSIHPETTET